MVEGRVKLAGPDPAEGRVVICEGGVKVDVCSYTWNGNAAAVVCRELGLATQGTCISVDTDINLVQLLPTYYSIECCSYYCMESCHYQLCCIIIFYFFQVLQWFQMQVL